MTDPASQAELAEVERRIDAWFEREATEHPAIGGWERGEDEERLWYVRLEGEEKANFSIVMVLGQRTLRFESYFMPAPEENREQVFENLLRRNAAFYGVAFEIGSEDAIYLAGQLDGRMITDDEIDRIIGSIYTYTEQCFRPAMRLGFSSRFAG